MFIDEVQVIKELLVSHLSGELGQRFVVSVVVVLERLRIDDAVRPGATPKDLHMGAMTHTFGRRS